VATPDEKRLYRTCLRRLSYRSEEHPRAFRLRNVENFPHESKPCSHNRGESQKPTEGGYGKVRHAKWRKPDGTVAVVAIKTLKVSQRLFVVSSLGFETILYRTPIAIRKCSSTKLLSCITSTPNMWFHFMVLQTLIIRQVLFRCGWMDCVYVATWIRKRTTSV